MRAALDYKYEPPEPPDYDFQGFKQPLSAVHRQYRDYRDHGIMPFAGGYYDQPPEWRHDMELYELIYNVRAWMVRRELKARDDRRDSHTP